jgi:superfamily II DNA or RNA helicase
MTTEFKAAKFKVVDLPPEETCGPALITQCAVDVTPEPVEAQMTELRPYQFEVLGQIEQAIAAGQRRILVTLPTGAGKTVCAADIIRPLQ